MTRETTNTQKIALLATGDEITQGDILNTNSQQIALKLIEHNIAVGTHIITSDIISDIENALVYLLKNNRGIIITGGLGPTSDDLTRYALSKTLQRPLIFDNAIWESICKRLKGFGYLTPPENNRQQALFPEGAVIIPNPNGTAAGCLCQLDDQHIFMLPGPPNECLPMIDHVVVPTLLQASYQQKSYRETWLLFGVSEGKIAEQLDAIAARFDCTTGYRLCYPYLEFKLHSQNAQELSALIPLIEAEVKPYLIGNGKQSASEQVKLLLKNASQRFHLCDQATGGLLEATLKTPLTHTQLLFSNTPLDVQTNHYYVNISGLNEYWQREETPFTPIRFDSKTLPGIEAKIPLRGDRVKLYAVEWVCQQLLQIMQIMKL